MEVASAEVAVPGARTRVASAKMMGVVVKAVVAGLAQVEEVSEEVERAVVA